MKVVVVKPPCEAETMEVDNHYKALQKVVDGPIEMVSPRHRIFPDINGILFYCNEEYMYQEELKLNKFGSYWYSDPSWCVNGNIIITKADKDGNDVELSEDEIKTVLEKVKWVKENTII